MNEASRQPGFREGEGPEFASLDDRQLVELVEDGLAAEVEASLGVIARTRPAMAGVADQLGGLVRDAVAAAGTSLGKLVKERGWPLPPAATGTRPKRRVKVKEGVTADVEEALRAAARARPAMAGVADQLVALVIEAVGAVRTGSATACPAGDPDTEEHRALRARLEHGQRASLVLFVRYRSRIETFARTHGLRTSVTVKNRFLPTVDEFLDMTWERAWARHGITTWRGDAPFDGWLIRVLQNLWRDVLRKAARDRKVDDAVRKEDRPDRRRAAGGLAPLPGLDSGTDAVEEPGDALDEPGDIDSEFVDLDPASTGREDNSLDARRQRFDRVIAGMPVDRRVVYRMSHGLTLTPDDEEHIARRRRQTPRSARDAIERLYTWFELSANMKISRIADTRARVQGRLEAALEALDEARSRLAQLLEPPGLSPAAYATLEPRIAAARRRVGRLILIVRDCQRKVAGIDKRMHPMLRIPSRRVAAVLGTTPANVDQHLSRARKQLRSLKEVS